MQLHFLFLNTTRLVEKYLCNQDTVTAVYVQKKQLNLGVLFGLFPDSSACIALSSTDGSWKQPAFLEIIPVLAKKNNLEIVPERTFGEMCNFW